MEVLESKKKQAAKVNKMRKKKTNAEEFKDPLEIGDICTISTNELKTKYFPYLPVLTLQEACDKLAAGCICRCKGDCAKNSRCTFNSSGSFRTTLRHKG
jgi:hypothetical protein